MIQLDGGPFKRSDGGLQGPGERPVAVFSHGKDQLGEGAGLVEDQKLKDQVVLVLDQDLKAEVMAELEKVASNDPPHTRLTDGSQIVPPEPAQARQGQALGPAFQ